MTAIVEQREKRTISMALIRDLTTGQWFIEQVELRFGVVRSLLRFSGRIELSEALDPRFKDLFTEFLPHKAEQHVLSISGPAIELPTMVMSDLRVLTQSAMGGVQRVIVRVNDVFGRIYDFLRVSYRPDPLDSDLAMLPSRNAAQPDPKIGRDTPPLKI